MHKILLQVTTVWISRSKSLYHRQTFSYCISYGRSHSLTASKGPETERWYGAPCTEN